MKRRAVLAGASAVASVATFAPLLGCEPRGAGYEGGWVGASHERGHLLRDSAPASKSGALPDAATTRHVDALVVGAGISGLGAARALSRAGIDDVQVLELEDSAGGNSRGHAMAGMRCPLGAHYLPVPGERAVEVVELLEELGVRKTVNGRAVYDERMLCHSLQERIFIGGGWREGLLPPLEALPEGERAKASADYGAFSRAVSQVDGGRDGPPDRGSAAFAIPTARSTWSAALDALDAVPFAAWLEGRGLTAPALRWYLDYCCRDDYGAGLTQVSAWAGLHYFASRHGFRAPGVDDARTPDANDGLLTWPEGNAWLAERLASPLKDRLQSGRVVLRVSEDKDGVSVDAWNVATRSRERWLAKTVVMATPLFVSVRLLEAPPDALVEAARTVRHAPWLVANLQLDAALDEQPGAPLSWDNVIYASSGLGYVDAMHQSMRPFEGPTVLTAYRALGGASDGELRAGRRSLLDDDWRVWTERVVADLAIAHPDLRAKLRRADLMRYGHAMSVPAPGLRSNAALQALAAPQRRVHFAHTDLSAYSVFEEALYHGTRAGRDAERSCRASTGSVQ